MSGEIHEKLGTTKIFQVFFLVCFTWNRDYFKINTQISNIILKNQE